MALYTPQQQSSIDAVLKARRNDASIPGGMTPEQMGVPAKPAQTPGVVPAGNVPVMPNGTAPPPPVPPTNPNVQGFTDFQKQQGDLMGQLQSYMQPMKYDPNTDPSYLAYKQLASAQAKDASGAALETLNSRGILNSSITRDDVAGIEQKYAAQAAAQIPVLQQQAYAQNRDRVADIFKLLGNSQDQQQRGIDNTRADAALTGNLQYDPNLVASVNQQMAANSKAYASASPEEQMRLHDENIKLAASIGGKDTTGSGDYEFTPQRTVQGQTLDNQVSETAYNHARDSLLDKRYEEKFNQDIKQQGFENALKIAVQEHQISNDNAQIAISAKNASTSAASAANSNQNAKDRLAFDKEQAANKSSTQTETVDDYAKKYLDGLAKYDNDGGLLNGTALESQILSSGKTDAEMRKLYARYGLKWGD